MDLWISNLKWNVDAVCDRFIGFDWNRDLSRDKANVVA